MSFHEFLEDTLDLPVSLLEILYFFAHCFRVFYHICILGTHVHFIFLRHPIPDLLQSLTTMRLYLATLFFWSWVTILVIYPAMNYNGGEEGWDLMALHLVSIMCILVYIATPIAFCRTVEEIMGIVEEIRRVEETKARIIAWAMEEEENGLSTAKPATSIS
ncbi:hypothetical protein RUND412_007822 [Rhizina undulata]